MSQVAGLERLVEGFSGEEARICEEVPRCQNFQVMLPY
jgi:hypothetical protein